MKLKLCILFSLIITLSSAQSKRENIWLFGYNSSNTLPGPDGMIFDFNNSPMEISSTPIPIPLNWNYSGICDTAGNLLFYTNGCAVANSQHQIMENGDNLAPGPFHDQVCELLGYVVPNSSIILPASDTSSLYYIFHIEGNLASQATDPGALKLFQTAVDIHENNGLGQVIEKNIIIIDDTLNYGGITAVKHANSQDWWLMVPQFQNGKYYTLLITENGVADIFEQEIGFATTVQGEGGGQAMFSPDGNLYLRSSPADGTFIFDFDRSTGLLSNFRFIPSFEDDSIFGGMAISPSSQFLYTFTSLNVFQYDLWAEDIQDSEVHIAEYDDFRNPFATLFYQGRIGPDCKIYVSCSTTVKNLHVIHNPDEKGLDCNFEQHAITLPFDAGRTLPNLPNFNLDIGPPCDTSLIVSSSKEPLFFPSNKTFKVFPNPAKNVITVSSSKIVSESSEWRLFNNIGQMVFTQELSSLSQEHSILLSNVPSGIYYYTINSRAQILQSGKILIIK
jgi:hypothetical protein